jgi:hypothetical protein
MAAMKPGMAKTLNAIIDAALRGDLDETHARRLHPLGPEAVALAMLAASKHIAEQEARLSEQDTVIAALQRRNETPQPSPSTPSGMVPIHTKLNTPKRRKKLGAKNGHPGVRRPAPTRIDRRESHRLKRCPCCGGSLQQCDRKRTRLIEDIPEQIQPVVTEHTLWRDYCPKCRKHVEPVIPDALPRATIGHHLIGLTTRN